MSSTLLRNRYFAVVALAAIALMALVAIQASRGGGATSSSLSSSAGLQGWVSYVIRDANGNIKAMGADHNLINADPIHERLAEVITGNVTGAFDGIAALNADAAADDPSDGTLSGSITLLLDGDSGTSLVQNPADGAITDSSDTDGIVVTAVTFTATGSATVKQIVLTKSIEDATGDGALAIATGDIFAYQDVPDIVLASGDTVTYTWTVTVS